MKTQFLFLMVVLVMIGITPGCKTTTCESDDTFMVVIDKESRFIFKAHPEAVLPLKHPRTEKMSIVKAMYCEKCSPCDRWKPIPLDKTPEEYPESFLCPKHKEPLKPTGRIPNDLVFVDEIQF